MNRCNCNRCKMDMILRRAEIDGMSTTTRPRAGGIDVFVHPIDREPDRSPEGKDFRAWFAALPDRCVG